MGKRFSIIFILLTCFCFIKHGAAQSYLNLDVAQNFSTFKFSHDPFETNDFSSPNPDYSEISTTAFGIGYKNFHSSGAFVGGGLGFRKGGASLVYKKINYLWNLQYIDIKAGIGYQYDRWRIKPFASVMPYYAYLLNAKQSIGLNYYDIKADKALKNFDLGIFLSLGGNVALSHYIAIYAEYSYNLGLKNIEPTEDQYLYNRGFAFKIGLSINVSNFKSMQDNSVKQSYDNAVKNNLDNFTPPNENILVTSSNNTEIKKNIANSGNNPVSPSGDSENEETPKIVSPGTVGWARSTSTTSNLKKSADNASISDELFTTDANTQKAGSSGLEMPTASNTPNTNKSTNPQPIKSSETNSNNQIAQTSSPSSKTTSAKTNSTYGAVPPSPDTEINTKKGSSDDKVVFKVQLTAVKNSLRSGHPILKEIKGDIKAEKGRDGWMRYYLGSYNTYEEAHKELKKIKAKGLAEGGFIVAFKNGKKITVAEAKDLLNRN